MTRELLPLAKAPILRMEAAIERLRQWIAQAAGLRGEAPRFFIQTFGCQQNENDSERLFGLLRRVGYQPSERYEDADLVLLNTCCIRDNADQRLFGHLGRLKALREKNRELIVAVCGCLPTVEAHAEKIRQSFQNVQILLGPNELDKLPEMLLRYLMEEKSSTETPDAKAEIVEGFWPDRQRSHRALVSIMYGCNKFCTYCIVPYTRGRERSRAYQDIVAEVEDAVAKGFREIMLLGQNVNAWGFDLQDKKRIIPRTFEALTPKEAAGLAQVEAGEKLPENFGELLLALSRMEGLVRIRYMSPHPRDFDAPAVAAIGRSHKIENHVHLPLQSGSDAILKRMNRHYDLARYASVVAALREARPGISITTDIIVGFPGESEEDFEATLEAVKRFGFDFAFTFIYSPRPGTPAAAWEQVPSAVSHERFERLAALQNALTAKSHEALLGQTVEVLLEGVSKGNQSVLTGRDSAFHLINIHLPESLQSKAKAQDGSLDSAYFEGRFAAVEVTEARQFSAQARWLGFRRE